MPSPDDPLKRLYQSLNGRGALPLEPDDPYYVEILQATPEKDPVLMLWQRLDWSESESVNLLTGFRGNGKSTELRRLKRLLTGRSGACVFLVDMADFLLMTKPLELSDFVLSLMTALGQAVERESGLKALTHKVVLLVDSVEQLRGVGTEAGEVHDSVVSLFSGQAASLAFPMLHVVYTIPPYLLPLSQNLGRSLGGHPIVSWPNVHVRHKNGDEDPSGLDLMEAIIQRRDPDWRDIVPRAILRRLATSTGGDLRDFFRLISECVISLRTARFSDPGAVLDDAMVDRVEEQLRNELLPIAEDDARWLARIHETKDASLPSTEELPSLARFLDGNLIMNYLNGEPLYDVHPLLVEEIRRFLPDGDTP